MTSWFDATQEEQSEMVAALSRVKEKIEAELAQNALGQGPREATEVTMTPSGLA